MLELIVFALAFGADQLLKVWAVNVLKLYPLGMKPLIAGFLHLQYAENFATNVSFIRGRSIVMNLIRVLQVALVLYLLIAQRNKLAKITRCGLALFLAGLIGNQFNYLIMNYVPDMFIVRFLPGYVFNLADVFVVAAMLILFIRLAFFEGQTFINWLLDSGKKRPAEGPPEETAQAVLLEESDELISAQSEEESESELEPESELSDDE